MLTMRGTESMTDFLDQQRFMEELEAQRKLVCRANGLSALVLIDLDFFKDINDKHGDLVGGKVVENFSNFLESSLRRSDICSHYGGEKFAVAMPATNVIQAAEKIDSIRKEFFKLEQISIAGSFNITFSAGIAPITSATIEVSGIIKAASNALYEAKNAGHNTVRIAP
jgi:diguanylate cyclase (GGDEF)-like protein